MATSTFRSLKEVFPNTPITLFTKSSLSQLGRGAKWCDTIFQYDRHRLHRGFWGWSRLWKWLRSQKFDLVLVLPNSFRSGLIGKLSGARYRVGYDRPGGIVLLSHRIKRLKDGKKFLPVYMGHYYGKLLDSFLSERVQQSLDLPLLEDEDQFARKYWHKVNPEKSPFKIAIAPGASFGSSKLWPTSHFAKLIDLLVTEYDPKILLIPGPGEENIADKIKSQSRSPLSILPPKQGKLGVLKSFLAQSDLLICNDSGARHIAHTFGVKTIVLMGPTDPRHSENPSAPYQVLKNTVPCAPCHLKRCPFEHHACMTGINPIQAFQATKRFMEQVKKDTFTHKEDLNRK